MYVLLQLWILWQGLIHKLDFPHKASDKPTSTFSETISLATNALGASTYSYDFGNGLYATESMCVNSMKAIEHNSNNQLVGFGLKPFNFTNGSRTV